MWIEQVLSDAQPLFTIILVLGGAAGASSIDFYGYNHDITMVYHDVW